MDGHASDDHARFRISRNRLQTSTQFDFDEQTVSNFGVRVTDKGGVSDEDAFLITAEAVSVT